MNDHVADALAFLAADQQLGDLVNVAAYLRVEGHVTTAEDVDEVAVVMGVVDADEIANAKSVVACIEVT